jgi:hypothetical protein
VTLVRCYGSKNCRACDTLAIQTGPAAASVRKGRGVCVAADHKGEQVTMYLLWGCGRSGPQSRRNDRDTHRALEPQPRGFAQSNGTQRPMLLPPAGCRQAQSTQPSHLAAINQIRRARRADTRCANDRDVALPSTLPPPPTLELARSGHRYVGARTLPVLRRFPAHRDCGFDSAAHSSHRWGVRRSQTNPERPTATAARRLRMNANDTLF